MSNAQETVKKMEAQLELWGVRIDELVAKAERAGAKAKVDHQRHIEDLRTVRDAAKSKLDELKAAGSDKWETVKNGADNAWSELERAYEALKD